LENSVRWKEADEEPEVSTIDEQELNTKATFLTLAHDLVYNVTEEKHWTSKHIGFLNTLFLSIISKEVI
jgi:hypothetical protein